MHDWSDKDVDWAGIEDAAEWIGKNLSRWGRIDVSQTKEKFGTVRVYCEFGGSLYTVLWPHEVMYYPELNKLQLLLGRVRVPSLFMKYQEFVYRKIYQKALKKWPHLTEEILRGLDWPSLVPEAGKYYERR